MDDDFTGIRLQPIGGDCTNFGSLRWFLRQLVVVHTRLDGEPTASTSTQPGDVIFYNWYQAGFEHMTVLVGSGKDPNSPDSGALVDAHTTNHYHAVWTLQPYNADWSTTSYTVFHINS